MDTQIKSKKPFRERVAEENRAQRALRAAGKPIPPELKKYARLSGLWLFLVPLIGIGLFSLILKSTGLVSVTFTLLFFVLSAIGLFELITGRHVISKK